MVAEHLLPLWLAELHSAHPEIAGWLDVQNPAGVIMSVLSGACDVGFVQGPRTPSGVRSAVAKDELVLVIGTGHPWSRRRSRGTAEKLADTLLPPREPRSGTRVRLDDELRARIGRPVIALQEFVSNAAVCAAVQAGAGAAVLSRLSVAGALATGVLRSRPRPAPQAPGRDG